MIKINNDITPASLLPALKQLFALSGEKFTDCKIAGTRSAARRSSR